VVVLDYSQFDGVLVFSGDRVMIEPIKGIARRAKLTKRVIDATRPEGKRIIVWDTELAGFGLRIEPSGLKTFVARYRAGGGRSGTLRQATIGRYGTLTVEEARTKAKKLLGQAAGGGDPVGDQQRARQAGVTIGEIVDWYLREAESGRLVGRRGRPIKPSTLVTDRICINVHVRPLLGNRSVQKVTVRDIEEMQADIAMGKTARKLAENEKRPHGSVVKGGSGTAARTLTMLSAILGHAVRHRLIETNPAKGARKFADRRRTTRLTLEQVRQLGRALREAMAANVNPTGLAVIRLLMLSGLRRSEALGLKPGWLIDNGISFPDTKTGAQMRPLGKAAMELLWARARGADADQWLFPGSRRDSHFVGLQRVLRRVCKLADLKGVTPHVLRHSYASIAAELGYSELTIAGLLGHAAGSVTAGYVHLDQALVTAADRVSAVIADALDGKAEAEVIGLRHHTG
jgi:integrase